MEEQWGKKKMGCAQGHESCVKVVPNKYGYLHKEKKPIRFELLPGSYKGEAAGNSGLFFNSSESHGSIRNMVPT